MAIPCIVCDETPRPCIPLPANCEGEPCEEVTDAKCVEYTDPEVLTNIGVNPGDRLNTIIKKWNQNQQTNTQAISVEDTLSIDLTGTGVGSAPVKADLRVDPVAGNLIKVTANGVKVVVDKALVTAILNLVINDPDLQLLFCQATNACNSCGGVVTNLSSIVK